MKRIILNIIFLIISVTSFAQLHQIAPAEKGDINKIIEINIGREVKIFNRSIGLYLPRCHSGWKSKYFYIDQNLLIRQVNRFKGILRADYIFLYDTVENKLIKREFNRDKNRIDQESYIENVLFLDENRLTNKLETWSFNARSKSKDLMSVEKNILRDTCGNITSYYRYYYSSPIIISKKELFKLKYDSLSRITKIELYDLEKTLKWIKSDESHITHNLITAKISEPKLINQWTYVYSKKGDMYLTTQKYYGELDNPNEDVRNDFKIFYSYDQRGNWIYMYEQIGDSNKVLKYKRKIRYKK